MRIEHIAMYVENLVMQYQVKNIIIKNRFPFVFFKF